MRSAKTVVMAVLGGLLAACGTSDEQRSAGIETPERVTTASSAGNVVHVYNWVDYIEPALIQKFTAETGIKVVYDTYESN